MEKRYRQVLVIIITMWIFFLIDSLVPLKSWGIIPREIAGLPGIFLAPLLHGGFSHIVSNTFPLLGLLIILSILYSELYWLVVMGGTVLGGSLVWLLGSKNIHIGASGLVFALAGFLLVKTFKENKWFFLFVGLIIFIFYSHLWLGLFPFFGGASNISYSSHWYGFISGIILAIMLKNKKSSLLVAKKTENTLG